MRGPDRSDSFGEYLIQNSNRPGLSWERFLDLARRVSANGSEILFRGQANAEWPIESLLLRRAPNGVSRKGLVELERDAIIEFQRIAHLQFPDRLLPATITHSSPLKLEEGKRLAWWKTATAWWALMQHYGAPTRLMDWTSSPYIASYFAVKDDPQRRGRIWCCNKTKLDELMRNEFGPPPNESDPHRYLQHLFPEKESIVDASEKRDFFFLTTLECSGRHHGQQGCFMMCKDPKAILGNQNDNDLTAERWLLSFDIPREFKPEFLRQLRLMNITGHSLFPDIRGLAAIPLK